MFTKEHYLKLSQSLNRTVNTIRKDVMLDSSGKEMFQDLMDAEMATIEMFVRDLEEMLIEDNPNFSVTKFEKEVYK